MIDEPELSQKAVALALRQYVDKRMYGRKVSNGRGRYVGERSREPKKGSPIPGNAAHCNSWRLSPALVAATDVPHSEAELILAMSIPLLASKLDEIAKAGERRLEADPKAGTPTGEPLPAPKPKAEPEAATGPAPEPEPEAPPPEFGR